MIKRLTYWIFLIEAFFLLCGCTRPTSLEDLNIVYGVAFDAGKNEEDLKATYHIPFYQLDSLDNVIVSTSGDSPKETQGFAELQLSGKLGDDKVKLILINQSLAKKSVEPFLAPFFRDKRVPALFKIAITEQPADSFLNTKNKRLDPSTQIVNMITLNERQNALPETSLYHFLNGWANPGEDPYLPLLTFKNNKPLISGIALFKDTKYVDTLRGYENILLLAMIQRTVQNAKYKFYWNDNRITTRIKNNSVHYKWHPESMPPRMDLNMKVKAILVESPHPLIQPTHAEFQEIESAFEKDLEKKINALLRLFQQLSIDPAGIGSIARSKQRNWQSETWNKIYPEVKYHVNVKVQFALDEL